MVPVIGHFAAKRSSSQNFPPITSTSSTSTSIIEKSTCRGASAIEALFVAIRHLESILTKLSLEVPPFRWYFFENRNKTALGNILEEVNTLEPLHYPCKYISIFIQLSLEYIESFPSCNMQKHLYGERRTPMLQVKPISINISDTFLIYGKSSRSSCFST